MNTFMKVFAAGLLASAPLGATAYAAGVDTSANANTGRGFSTSATGNMDLTPSYASQSSSVEGPGSGSGTYNGLSPNMSYGEEGMGSMGAYSSQVDVLTLRDLSRAEAAMYRNRAKEQPGHIAQLQASIRSNPALAGALRAQNVDIHDVIGTRKGADGSVAYVIG